ncbi:hypothetical protein ACIBSV_11565 [Embleya sp. NPDC050154]|uniref:hypothetical protein n=1 Tax=Embleya sp. NPDC050154 TaxID=3363988 RepID=UPI00378EAAD6
MASVGGEVPTPGHHEAIALFEEDLAARTRAVEPDHGDTWGSRHHLAPSDGDRVPAFPTLGE